MAFGSAFAGGVAGGSVVNIVIRAIDDYSRELKNANKQLSGFKGASKSLTGVMGGAVVATAALTAGIGAVGIQASATAEPIKNSFNNLFGDEAPKALESFRAATRGTVSDLDLMTQANNAMLLGIDPDALPEMFKGALAAGKATGRPVKDAIADITTGIGRQSRMILDNLGIIVKQEDANIAYAESIGKSVSELDDQDKKMAFTQATMEALANNAERLGEVQDDLTMKTDRAKASFANLKVELGDGVRPAFDQAMAAIAPSMETLSSVLRDDVMPAFQFAFDAMAGFFEELGDTGAIDTFLKVLGNVLKGLFTFTGLVFKGMTVVVGFINVLFQWAAVIKDKVVNAFNFLAASFKVVWLGMKLVFYEVINDIIGGLEFLLQKGVDTINGWIDAANEVPGVNIGRVSGVSLGRIDTAGVEQELVGATADATAAAQFVFNIDSVQGLDPDAVAEALQKKISEGITL